MIFIIGGKIKRGIVGKYIPLPLTLFFVGRSENLEDKGTIDPGMVRNTESLSQLMAIMKTQTFSYSDRSVFVNSSTAST